MRFVFILIALVFCEHIAAQTNLKGVWQGVLFKSGAPESESTIIYLELEVNGNTITGKTREEYYKTDYYNIQKIKGSVAEQNIAINQFTIEKKKIYRQTVCSVDMDLKYTDSTGYLTGTFVSSTCRGYSGKIILYRSVAKFSTEDKPMIDHYWRDRFLTDVNKGRKAPEIQEKERRNFQFQPIFFDHDKAEIKPEFYSYLARMARVVNGHSDLRIKITGHTDSDGSDAYNVDLSARRAKAIQAYFLKCGLESFKLVIDFKGEKMPVDNNDTREGKQKNRRVDFAFI